MFQLLAERQKRFELAFFAITAAFLFLMLFKLPFYPIYFESDQIIFLHNAERMLNGDVMYRDFFQFTFPGGQTLYFLLFKLFGAYYFVLPLVILVVGVLSVIFITNLSKIINSGIYAYIPAFLYIFFGFRWFGLDGSHRTLSPLFVLLAAMFLAKGNSRFHTWMAAVSCAIASFFTQQRGLVTIASVVCFVLIDNKKNGIDWKTSVSKCIEVVLVFCIVLLGLCSYFIETAGSSTFVNSTLIYPFNYYQYHEQNNIGSFFNELRRAVSLTSFSSVIATLPAVFYSFVLPLTPFIFLFVFIRNRNSFDWHIWRVPCLLFLVGAFALLSMPNPNFLRYYQNSAPLLILFIWLLQHFQVFDYKRRFLAYAVATLLLIFAFSQAYRTQYFWNYLEIDSPRGRVYAIDTSAMQRYIWLKENTKPGDYVYEVYDPFVYFLLGLKSASGHSQIFPTAYTRPEFVEIAIIDLKDKKPKYIIWDLGYNKKPEEREIGDHTGPLAEFLQHNYKPASPVFKVDKIDVQIWELKTH